MKSVLISIQPKWCEKIANGEKTVEVRKTKPKLKPPFKCYIYRTKGVVKHLLNDEWFNMHVGGKVIGEFVCDEITQLFNVCKDNWDYLMGETHEWHKALVRQACLAEQELREYADHKNCFAWHISDLVIYDELKELSEFRHCGDNYHFNPIVTRPPQSWCYVEGGADNG